MSATVVESSGTNVTSIQAMVERVTAYNAFLDQASRPRGLSLSVEKKRWVKEKLTEKHGKDWKMFNLVYPYLKKTNKELADKLKVAMHSPLITKKFYDPNVVEEKFLDFVSPDTKPMHENPNFERACRDIESLLGRGILQPLRLSDNLTIDRVFTNKKASAGSIFPGRSKEEAWDIIYSVAEWYYSNLPKEDPFVSLPFARAQISGYLDDNNNLTPEKTKHKQRLVWCINAGMVLVEALYAKPLMMFVLPKVAQYAGGKSPLSIRTTLQYWRRSRNWLCLDYSSYDATVPKWLIKRVFDIIKKKFPNSEHDVIDWICYHFIHTRLVLPDGRIVQKCKGIPSGSFFTQIVGSLANMIMIRTWQYSKYGSSIKQFTEKDGRIMFMVMGDDNIVFTADEINRKELSAYLKYNFGVVVHTDDKVDYGTCFDDPVFLKRTWRKNGEWRNPLELFINMCHPERFRKYDTYSPIHVLLGYCLAYKLAITPFISEREIRKLLAQHGGIDKILNMPGAALPGSIYWIKITDPALFKSLVREIEREEAILAEA